MTDRHLRDALLDEIPEPAPGYWAEIERRLTDGPSERVPTVGAMGRDTDRVRSTRRPLFAVAAVLVLLVAVAAALFDRSGEGASTDVRDRPDATPVDGPDSVGEADVAESDDSHDTALTFSDEYPAVYRLESSRLGVRIPVYADPGTDAAPVDDVRGSFVSTGRVADDGEGRWIELIVPTQDDPVWAAEDTTTTDSFLTRLPPLEGGPVTLTREAFAQRSPDSVPSDAVALAPSMEVSFTGVRVLSQNREWLYLDDPAGYVPAEYVEFERSDLEALDPGAEGPTYVQPFVDRVFVWYDRGAPTELRHEPSIGAEVVAIAGAGQPLVRTGRRVLSDGREWLEVTVHDLASPVWVFAFDVDFDTTFVSLTIYHRCYRGLAGTLLTLEFADRDTLTAALLRGDEPLASRGRAVEGGYVVATHSIGTASETGALVTASAVWSHDGSTFTIDGDDYETADCADVRDDVDRLVAEVGIFPSEPS